MAAHHAQNAPASPPSTPPAECEKERRDVESQTVPMAGEGGGAAGYGKNMREPPDGGAAAWMVVLGAWCTSFCSFGWINSVGTFQNYYESTILSSYSASQISWIPSLQIFFMFAMGPIVGKMYDQHGPRQLLLVGTFLHVFGLMMASISTHYYQLILAQGVCSAIGVACIFQPALSCVGGWFTKNRGFAYGVLTTGSSVGGVIFPIMVSRLIVEIGYGWTERTAAFVILLLLIVANLTIRSLNPPNPIPPTKEELLKPLHEVGMLSLFLGVSLLTFGIFIPITYLVVEASAQGMSPNLAQYLLAMLNAASLFGRLGSGLLADKIGRYNVFAVVCYTTGILVLALWIPATSNAAIIMFAILFGFFSGAYVSLSPALVAQISPIKEIGFRTGLVFLVSSIGGLTTGPIAGAILTSTGSFLGMKIFSGVLCLAGTTVIFAARLYETGPKLMVKF